MHAVSGQGVQVGREGRHQGFALAGFHLGNAPLVQHDAAEHLDVEMPLAQHAVHRLANDRKGFGQQIVERFAVLQPPAEHVGHSAQLLLGQAAVRLLKGINFTGDFFQAFDFRLVGTAEQRLENIRHGERYLLGNWIPKHFIIPWRGQSVKAARPPPGSSALASPPPPAPASPGHPRALFAPSPSAPRRFPAEIHTNRCRGPPRRAAPVRAPWRPPALARIQRAQQRGGKRVRFCAQGPAPSRRRQVTILSCSSVSASSKRMYSRMARYTSSPTLTCSNVKASVMTRRTAPPISMRQSYTSPI